jgi:8-oxo-dGTP diphosphatase
MGADVAQTCEACRATLYHSSKPGVGVVLVRPGDDAVLLIRRRWPPYRGQWGLPGGFVSYGETPEAAAIREVREETGLEIRTQRLIGTWIEDYRRPQGVDRLLSLYYIGQIVGGREQPGDEVTALAWFGWDALPSNLARPHLPVLQASRAAP